MRVKVDTSSCCGHARCAAKAPNVYVLNADGYNDMTETVVPAELKDEARKGALACPEGAIALVEDLPEAIPESRGRRYDG